MRKNKYCMSSRYQVFLLKTKRNKAYWYCALARYDAFNRQKVAWKHLPTSNHPLPRPQAQPPNVTDTREQFGAGQDLGDSRLVTRNAVSNLGILDTVPYFRVATHPSGVLVQWPSC